ncbi:hypothetical protein [Nocardia sp. NPDC057227]|uniref:hypothetical protein n=1 Tax=Nocardia sp. NPDC057227 TaxID=3346056 RepID=UPI0036414B30
MDDKTALMSEIDAMRTLAKEIELLPDGTASEVDKLIEYLRIGQLIGTVPSLGIGLFVNEYAISVVENNRRDIEDSIDAVLTKVRELQVGEKVPVTFIDRAAGWRNLAAAVTNARDFAGGTDLRSEWGGIAAERYFFVGLRQAEAFKAVPAIAEKVAANLEAVAKGILDSYKKIVTALLEIKNEILGVMSGLSTKGPVAIFQLDQLVKTLGALQTRIFTIVGECATISQNNMIAGNQIALAPHTEAGFPGDRWPPASIAATGIDERGQKYDYELEFDDASALDGDASDWKVKT